jgi:hypothetical protein
VFVADPSDPDYLLAIEENQVVILKQRDRVIALQAFLVELAGVQLEPEGGYM